MISLIPPVIGITILVSLLLLVARDGSGDADFSRSLARDMAAHHLHQSADLGETGGILSNTTRPWPFEALGPWETHRVTVDGRDRLLTFPGDFESVADDRRSAYLRMLAGLRPALGRPAEIGRLSVDESGFASFGNTPIPDAPLFLPDGAPAILR